MSSWSQLLVSVFSFTPALFPLLPPWHLCSRNLQMSNSAPNNRISKSSSASQRESSPMICWRRSNWHSSKICFQGADEQLIRNDSWWRVACAQWLLQRYETLLRHANTCTHKIFLQTVAGWSGAAVRLHLPLIWERRNALPSHGSDSKQKITSATLSHNNKQMTNLRVQTSICKLFMVSVLDQWFSLLSLSVIVEVIIKQGGREAGRRERMAAETSKDGRESERVWVDNERNLHLDGIGQRGHAWCEAARSDCMQQWRLERCSEQSRTLIRQTSTRCTSRITFRFYWALIFSTWNPIEYFCVRCFACVAALQPNTLQTASIRYSGVKCS